MKKTSNIVCCTLLVGLSIGTASAQPVAVQLTGHVRQWQDNTGLLGVNVPNQQPVTALYTYDTVMPIGGWPPVTFMPSANQASIVVNMGPFTFQTGSASQLAINVNPGSTNGTWGNFFFNATNNPALYNGVPVTNISIQLEDPSGAWPVSTAPPVGAPTIADLSYSTITVSGSNQSYYQFVIQVDSVALVPPAIDISPAAGRFLPQQHFDAAVWLPISGAPVATMQASVAGTPVALNYPGTCQLAPGNSSGRAALLCPGADAALGSLQGVTQIDWQVTLTDGSSLTQSVQWNLVR